MKILAVEDEHRIAQSIKKGLEQEHFAVDLAYTGTDGYDLASTEDYDVIILDLMLPQMDGIAICRELRKTPSFGTQSRQTPTLKTFLDISNYTMRNMILMFHLISQRSYTISFKRLVRPLDSIPMRAMIII